MIFIAVLIVLVLDQLTKIYVTRNFPLNKSVPLINGVLHITPVHNRGAAFGILKNQVPMFIFAAAVAVTLIYLNLKRNKQKGPSLYSFSLTLILAGALGNLVDRLAFGYVIDFIDLRVWPVFNVADSAITVGAVLLGYHVLFGSRKEKTCIL